MSKVLSVLLVLMLGGCGEQSSIENAVRENLRDPESAKFRDSVVSKNGSRACVEWNSKNGFGGYGEWEVTSLTKINGEWAVSQMQVSSADIRNCSKKSLDRAESTEAAVKHILEMSKNM